MSTKATASEKSLSDRWYEFLQEPKKSSEPKSLDEKIVQFNKELTLAREEARETRELYQQQLITSDHINDEIARLKDEIEENANENRRLKRNVDELGACNKKLGWVILALVVVVLAITAVLIYQHLKLLPVT